MPQSHTLRIATRNSPLALWQARHIQTALSAIHPHLQIEIEGFLTEGDRRLSASLAKVGGKGLFVKELEIALLEKKADIAVHSLKDMPAHLTPGLQLATYCEREDPRDVFLSPRYANVAALPSGAIVGTSSSRRACLLAGLRQDLKVEPLRGNVGTRLKKLDDGQYDAIILAAAGLKRLGEAARIRCYLETNSWIPAVGQAAIGIECLADNDRALELLAPLDHTPTRIAVMAERACNQVLDGGCQLPIAVHATCADGQLMLRGFVGNPDTYESIRAEYVGSVDEPEVAGERLAELLLEKGAGGILKQLMKKS